jgi:hypothetical protein
MQEFKDGKHEPSVITTQTMESMSIDEKQMWRTIRKELEEIGISVAGFDANKDFILNWFRDAVSTGAFEEQSFEDDSGSTYQGHGLSQPLGESVVEYCTQTIPSPKGVNIESTNAVLERSRNTLSNDSFEEGVFEDMFTSESLDVSTSQPLGDTDAQVSGRVGRDLHPHLISVVEPPNHDQLATQSIPITLPQNPVAADPSPLPKEIPGSTRMPLGESASLDLQPWWHGFFVTRSLSSML